MAETELQIAAARRMFAAIPQVAALGIVIDEMAPGKARMTMPYDARLVGDPVTGVIHGGAVSTLLDTCSGAAVACHPQAAGPTATIDLRINYIRPADPGQAITARAECYHVTRSFAFIRATAHDDDTSLPVAEAVGTFTFEAGPRVAT